MIKPLTKKQREAYELYKEGLTEQEIAQRLKIDISNVSRRLTGVAKKLGYSEVYRYNKRTEYDV